MIIVSGRIFVEEDGAAAFAADSREAVAQARRTDGCLDFIVAPDPLEANRVNVYEEWTSEEALKTFRGGGPGDDLGAQIVSAEVKRHHISSSGPA